MLVNALAGALTCGIVWQLGPDARGRAGSVAGRGAARLFPEPRVLRRAHALRERVHLSSRWHSLLAGVRLLARDAGSLSWLAWGIGVGIVTMVRSETVTWFVLPAAALLRWHALPRAAGVLAATFLGTMLALTPWIVRNARVFGAFVPTNEASAGRCGPGTTRTPPAA